MLKALLKPIRNFLSAPKLKDIHPTLESKGYSMRPLIISPETEHNDKMRSIALANFELEKEAQQQSLNIQHRNMMIALVAVIVALLSSAIAVVIAVNSSKANVVVKLEEPHGQKTIQTTN